ncbi:helix-turn-helix domain-containing protein [Opitutus terrae]|uniref:Transcriptional regulator, XRE family n=1 Tax=Opitutus terrae (strain DSM 11246 / JCM 15787 / PB90-1) TaxID=452637 RepID=B1ZV55_OPITP|nr:helix-turn-helix transcriptional regulator [Opitutus terrae]ACB76722.1 transcriptional regulator, XRE family [Opitutus terrae PB90-1]
MAAESAKELRALGEAIRAGRKTLGLSQEDFAERCDVHRTYVGQVERGEKNISFTNVLRIARAIGQKPSVLLGKAGL